MRKFLTLLLAVMMIASMSVTAFATGASSIDDNGAISGNTTCDVMITSSGTDNSDVVYYVVVEWKTLTFTYSFNSNTAWNPEKHAYENGTDAAGTWYVGTGDTMSEGNAITDAITVKNHSNADVWVAAKFGTNALADNNAKATNLGVEAVIGNGNNYAAGKIKIANAEGTEYNNPPETVFSVSVSGTPLQSAQFKLDTITVNVSDNAN